MGIIGAQIDREDVSEFGQAWMKRPVQLRCEVTGKSHARLTAWCRRPDGADLSCEAISAGIAVQWPKFDPTNLLGSCNPRIGRATSGVHPARRKKGRHF